VTYDQTTVTARLALTRRSTRSPEGVGDFIPGVALRLRTFQLPISWSLVENRERSAYLT
jgi:hypothetical protein